MDSYQNGIFTTRDNKFLPRMELTRENWSYQSNHLDHLKILIFISQSHGRNTTVSTAPLQT